VSEPLEFRILGPFEARRDGRALELPAGKSRGLLALLLLHRNEVVSVDTLVDRLWGERPPATAAKNVQVYVSHLRKALGDGTLLTRTPGYLLRLEPGQLDVDRFQALLEEARGQQPAQAAERLRAALALWRGEPLADFRYDSFAQEEIRRLEELRLAALEERIEAELALGRHEDVLSELESLARANPLRERLQGQLMLALYRCGRQAEALEAYRAARRRLVEELGLEPSPELQRLERAILAHDPTLAAPARVARPDRGAAAKMPSLFGARRGRLLVVAGVIVLAAAAVGVGLRLSGARSPTLRASPNSVAVVDASHDSVRQVIAGVGRLGGIATGAHAVWATDTVNDFLLRIDPTTGTIEDRIEVGDGPTGVAVGDRLVWVVNQLDRTVSEVNPRARKEVDSFAVGNGADAIAFGDGSVWVANETDGTLSRINPAGTTRVKTIPLVGTPDGIAIGRQGVWVTSPSTGELLLVDPKTNQVVQPTPIGNGPTGVALGSGAVWVANTPDGTVSRFDPGSGKVTKFPVADAPAGVAYGDGAVWVANGKDGTVSRIDPRTGSRRDVEVGNEPTSLAFAGGDIWTTVLPSPASHRGGTLRVVSYPNRRSLGSIDPAQPTAFAQLPMLSLTNDGLVTYRRVAGLGGDQLVPDLATRLPEPTNGGRTYTFRLRRGIRYSNGQPVRARDFRRGLERVFGLRDFGWFYQGILGGSACERRPQACDLSRGIVADDTADTVTFHLTAPDGNFLYKLAFPAADAVPKGAPPDSNVGRKPLPATGPYMTRSFSPGRSWILVRNPRFHEWSADAQPEGFPDRIVMTQFAKRRLATQVAGIEHGSADVLSYPGLRYLGRLATRFASQLHSDPLGVTTALAMNTREPPFDRRAVRRALNYAIDRNRIVRYFGGPLLARPTCQILAPTQPGYRPYCPYTIDPSAGGTWTAPDYARAAKLVEASGTRGMKVTLLIEPPDPNAPTVKVGRYVVSVLDQLGYRASLKAVPPGAPHYMMGNPRSHLQIGWITWNVFFSASPSDFVNDLSCRAFSPRSSTNANVDEFCSPRIDAQVRRASELLAQNPAAAADAWNRVDRELADEAPLVPLFNTRDLVLLSGRVGNYEYHPFWNILLDQLWVR
jgi:ABC-type transport system substrate-binding protein/DNA-binding SARP family transcriptional activator/streptogramin lyase